MEIVKRVKAFISSYAPNLFFLLSKRRNPPPPASAATTTTTAAACPVAESDQEMVKQKTPPILAAQNNSYNSTPVVDWGKSILDFCFMTAIALLTLTLQTPLHHLPFSFHLLCFSVLLAFASSLYGILFRLRFPNTAKVLEQIAMIFAVLAFFMAMEMSIEPSGLKCFTWFLFAFLFVTLSIYSLFYQVNTSPCMMAK